MDLPSEQPPTGLRGGSGSSQAHEWSPGNSDALLAKDRLRRGEATEDPLAVGIFLVIYGILILLVLAPLWRFDVASPPTDLFRVSGA